MGKFRQISTELCPLIDVRNWFSLSIFVISLLIFFKLCLRVDIGNECLGIADANILSNNYRVMALDVQNCFLLNILTNGQVLIFLLQNIR